LGKGWGWFLQKFVKVGKKAAGRRGCERPLWVEKPDT